MRHLSQLYLRAFRLRCPACGGGPVFVSWLRMCPSCPSCALNFDREPEGGYWIGSYSINLFATETVFAVAFVAALIFTWPTPPWDTIIWADVALMVGFPILFFPWSKTLFIAVDLTFRPEEPGDFDQPREPSPLHRERRG
ncbi:MAG TPA: DUF983 domain-containing protein [Gemmatimonadales bacterium]|jgi:uncharacterized protein (DUF983 family)